MTHDGNGDVSSTDMSCPSLLWHGATSDGAVPSEAPGCLTDLNLDQVVTAIVADRDAPGLRSLFHTPLRDVAEVTYRHQVFRDLQRPGLRAQLDAFSAAMAELRAHERRASTIRNRRQRTRLHLDGAVRYCAAVRSLRSAMCTAEPEALALRGVATYLDGYVRSERFATLDAEAAMVERDLSSVHYGLTVLEDRVHVRTTVPQPDHGEALAATFDRFRRQERQRPAGGDGVRVGLNEVEAGILELVVRLHPEPFAALDAFAARHEEFRDPHIVRLDQELQFYRSYLDYMQRFEPMALAFCFPEVSSRNGEIRAHDAFDVALAQSLQGSDGTVVCNDLRLGADERFFVVTGANQGGKTTFARMFGQLHYLAALGCPVPAREARLLLADGILTHFEREESPMALQGKLQEELTRLHEVLARVSGRSIVIMNEAFASATSDDAIQLGRATLERLLAADASGVYVTFVDELAALDVRIASLTACVDPDDPVRRTFKIVRRAADGRAHALAIARAYHLTYDDLRARLEGSR